MLKRATPEELAHLSLSLKEVKTITLPDFQQRLFWTDEVGEILIAKGDVVTVTQPNQEQNGKYWFDSSIITEFGISLAESAQPGADTY